MADIKPIFLNPQKVFIEGVEIAIGDGPEELTWEELCDFMANWNKVKDLPAHE